MRLVPSSIWLFYPREHEEYRWSLHSPPVAGGGDFLKSGQDATLASEYSLMITTCTKLTNWLNRTRRVKCGEERPKCARCINFGTSCTYTRTRSPGHGISRFRSAPLAPRLTTEVIPSLFRIEIEEVYRYFEVFRSRTSFKILSRSCDIESLRIILLQACASQSSIRHAVAALGALEKTSEATPATLQYDDHWGSQIITIGMHSGYTAEQSKT